MHPGSSRLSGLGYVDPVGGNRCFLSGLGRTYYGPEVIQEEVDKAKAEGRDILDRFTSPSGEAIYRASGEGISYRIEQAFDNRWKFWESLPEAAQVTLVVLGGLLAIRVVRGVL